MTVAGVESRRDEVGFRFDLNLCTGCNACELACSTENQLGWGRSWRQVVPFNEDKLPSLPTYHLSLACNHCTEAPCISACPAQAIDRDRRTGAVLIRSELCIGCRYCSWACPYDAPRFDQQTQIMGKCTWCDHRLQENRDPACVEQCPTGALAFGPLRGAAAVGGFPETAARPMIRFQPLNGNRLTGPECSWQPPVDVVESFAAARPVTGKEISFLTEWPLWIFTLLASFLVGWILASLGGSNRPDPVVFVGLAGLAAVASTLHLGRKLRAWRAVLNLRSSWLSREVTCYSLFTAIATLHCAVPEVTLPGLIAGGFGVLTLYSIDRVYDVVRPIGSFWLHSADTLLTGLLVAALLLAHRPSVLLILALKLGLYMARHMQEGGASGQIGSRWRPVWWALRIGLGFVVPTILWVLQAEMQAPAALAGVAAGEMLDRAEFYNELEIGTPRRQIGIDLERMGAASA